MKKLTSLLSGLLTLTVATSSVFIPGFSVLAATKVQINATNFPDKVFRDYILENIDNGDGVLNQEEIDDTLLIDLFGWSVESVKGIEFFPELYKLEISSGSLTSLDVSKNANLSTIECFECWGLTHLDVSNNKKLVNLFLYDCNVDEIDVSANTELQNLTIRNGETKLSKIDVSNNAKLTELAIEHCGISSLDVTKNSELVQLRFSENNISTIDLSKNKKLEVLDCSSNALVNINIENNPLLHTILCRDNQITDLKLGSRIEYLKCDANFIKEIDVSGTHFADKNLIAEQRKNRTFIHDDGEFEYTIEPEIDSVAWNDYLMVTDDYVKITGASISLPPVQTDTGISERIPIDSEHFPDDDFRKIISGFDENNDGKLSKMEISNIKELSVSFWDEFSISSVKGVEYLTELEEFNCSGLNLSSLDVSHNTKLKTLICNYNQLKSLDLRFNTELEELQCGDADLSALDLSSCSKLKTLICDGNRMPILDVSKCPNLKRLSCYENGLLYLDITNNPALVEVKCYDNNIAELDLSNNPNLMIFECHGNPIRSLDFSKTKIADAELLLAEKSINVIYDGKKGGCWWHFGSGDTGETYFYKDYCVTTSSGVYITGIKCLLDVGTKPSSSTKGTVEDFAERLYTTCLGRASEEEGKAYWASELKKGKTGAEVAIGFFFSKEIENQKLSDEEFVTRLYKTFMNREPESNGMDYWLEEIKKPDGRRIVFDGFVNSPEWADICLAYGIKSGGGATPSSTLAPSKDVVNFAARLYTTCLGRNAEADGLKYWAYELANLRTTGTEAARGFFFSDEFVGKNLSDKEYITRLYKTFMNRDPENDGFSYWMDQMKNGASRESVFYGFASAEEFAALCRDAGIIA